MHHGTRPLVVCLALVAATLAPAADVSIRTYAETAPDGAVSIRPIHAEPSAPSSGVTPLAIALVPAIGLPPDDWSVAGLRIDLLVGRHRDVWGVDIGLLGNEVSESFEGLQIAGLFNRIGRSDGAWQTAGILNRCEGDFCGLQSAGALNWTDGAVEGVQIALLNRATELSGLQLGLYNAVDCGSGVQIGLVNAARSFDGLQIGIINVIRDSSVPFFPIINVAF